MLVQQSVNRLPRAILYPGLTSITKYKLMNRELAFVCHNIQRKGFQKVLQADMERLQEAAAPDLKKGFKGSS